MTACMPHRGLGSNNRYLTVLCKHEIVQLLIVLSTTTTVLSDICNLWNNALIFTYIGYTDISNFSVLLCCVQLVFGTCPTHCWWSHPWCLVSPKSA